MYIKRIFLGILVLSLLSCSGEKDAYFGANAVKVSTGTDCLAETFSKLDEFLLGTLPDAGVIAFWDCASTALDSIEKYVIGSEINGDYKATDIRWFVETYFLKKGKPGEIKISNELLDELMAIKGIFLGGNREYLTKKEIASTRNLIKEFRQMTLSINPHIRTLFYSEKGDVSQTEVGKATTAFSAVVIRLGDFLQRQGNQYEFSRLVRFITEIDKIFNENDKKLPSWLDYLPGIQKIKGKLLNSSSALIEKNEWKSVMKLAAEGLSAYFRIKHYFNTNSLYQPDQVIEFSLVYKSIENIFSEGISVRHGNPISKADVEDVLIELVSLKILPDAFTPDELKQLWGVLVNKMLRTEGVNEEGLSRAKLDVLTKNIQMWYRTQRWILGDNSVDEDTIKEMKGVFNSPWTYRTDSEGRLIFDRNKSPIPNIEAATQMNWLRAAFHLLINGYAEDIERRNNMVGLTREELDSAFKELKPLFVEVGLIKPDNDTFQNSVYLEASLFMPRANGDAILNFYEMIEYVHFILPATKMGKAFVAKLGPECLVDKDTVDWTCFRQGFRALFKDSYASMPLMTRYLSGLKTKDFWKAMDGFEGGVRNKDLIGSPIAIPDISKIGIMMQYIEVLMFRLDVDQSQRLNLAEGLSAIPLFEYQLMKLLDIKDKKQFRQVLTYMLKYGKPPNPKNVFSLISFLHWTLTEKSWKLDADRGKIISILGTLGDYL